MTGHYFDESPSVASRPRTIHVHMRELDFDLVTDRGVFSADRLDLGTRVLLELAPPPPSSGDVLDLGCGYGPIAIVLAMRSPDATVWAVDVNERARALAEENARRLGCANVRVAAPEDVSAETHFAATYSNPPTHVGKQPLHDLLLRWLPRLAPDAHAYLVVQKHLGSDSLARWLHDEHGYTVERIGSRSGYRVLDIAAP